LHDGTPVLIRPIERTDLELERAFVNGLSRETRYWRLMSGRELLPGELERWTDVDPAHEIALIAVASVIGDEWQGHGLGRALLTRLMQLASMRESRSSRASRCQATAPR